LWSAATACFFFDTRDPQPGLSDLSFSVEVEKPTLGEQRDLWAAALGTRAGELAARLTSQFNLSADEIRRIAGAALAETASQDEGVLGDRLWDACRVTLRPRVEALAQRLDPRATWGDIVLADEALDLLRQIGDQVGQRGKVYEEWGFASQMNRGLGISALFAGDSGTGKTMAAEVIANHLRLDLYRIDLSAVVSKYIGETEKNLRKLFDTVEDGGAILFFDEADALFGKRSEVKDSHDRYANIEINYLLQRMEAYRGLAILATNMKSALDTAFMRRLRFVVNFPFPAPEQRRQMWQKAFPPATPRAGLDYDRLARLNLTGGNIHTVAINAAFMAANAGSGVTMEHVLKAARIEFRKLDRAINEADFRWA
jgi:SpoVK/Ycf46/Vps4 family AAA+-type ATPase